MNRREFIYSLGAAAFAALPPFADTGTMTVTYGLDEFKAWNSLKSRNWGALHVAVRPRETFGGVGRALEADVKAAERIGT